MKTEFVTLKNGIRVAYVARKTSDNWIVCLHGIQSNKALFDSFFEHPAFSSFSILTIDFLGFGESDKPQNDTYDLQTQTEIIQKIIQYMNIQNIHIIGHSLGGMIGTILLSTIPKQIQSFVNMEGNLTEEDCGVSISAATQPFEVFSKKWYPEYKQKLENSKKKEEQLRAEWMKQTPDYVFYRTSESIVHWSKEAKLLKWFIQFPGKKMYMFGAENKQKTEKLPNDIIRAEIPNTGHFMLMKNFEMCCSLIKKFLS